MVGCISFSGVIYRKIMNFKTLYTFVASVTIETSCDLSRSTITALLQATGILNTQKISMSGRCNVLFLLAGLSFCTICRSDKRLIGPRSILRLPHPATVTPVVSALVDPPESPLNMTSAAEPNVSNITTALEVDPSSFRCDASNIPVVDVELESCEEAMRQIPAIDTTLLDWRSHYMRVPRVFLSCRPLFNLK